MPTFYGTDTDATQKNYLQSRINTLYWSKYSDLQRAFGLANDERPTTAKDLIDRITAGKYVLRDDSDYQEDFDYDFGGLFGIIWRDPSVKKDRDGFNKANDALEAAKQDAIDLIVISDAATGLKAVQDFATKTFH
jgi:hypothetical protein